MYKISKRNLLNNKISKKIINKGGKPKIGNNVYTYFIMAHGYMTNHLDPLNKSIEVPENGSIITITDVGICSNSAQAHSIVKFYIEQQNRLFEELDTTHTKTVNAQQFIRNTLKPLEIDGDQINIRNHVVGSKLNNVNITFKPNNQEFLGVIRYNHTTNITEHYDINKLKQFEKEYNENGDYKYNLKSLIYRLFDTKERFKIKFDNHVTIIPMMCRKFDKDLSEDMDKQSIIRTLSSESDEVRSTHGIVQINPTDLTIMPFLDDRLKWLGVNTKVLLNNGTIAFIKDLYLYSVKYNMEILSPKLLIKGHSRKDLNGKECFINGNFDMKENKWPIRVNNEFMFVDPDNIELSMKILKSDVHREDIKEILP
jgi:hypothetical protein